MGNLLGSQYNADESESTSINPRKKILVLIEGNISSGKSTLVRNLKAQGYQVYEEAVDRLTNEYIDVGGRNILDLFYSSMKEYAFKLQLVSLATRRKIMEEALDYLNYPNVREDPSLNPDIVFVERSLHTDVNSFALNLFEQGLIDPLEWKIYLDLLSGHLNDTKPHFEGIECHYIYLRTDADECFRRKIERGRVEETAVPLDYFKTLQEKNDAWLLTPHDQNSNDEDSDSSEIQPQLNSSQTILHRHISRTMKELRDSFQQHKPIVVDGNSSQEEVLTKIITISKQLLEEVDFLDEGEVIIRE